ncbi:MAG: S9 family peptidase [Crocinitomicaceae bacterium]
MKIKYFAAIALIGIIPTVAAQTFNVEKIWKEYAFSGKSVQGFRSMNNGDYFSKISKSNGQEVVSKHAFSNYNGDGEVLINTADIKFNGEKIAFDDYYFNSDETKALLTTETTPIYRHSYTAVYYLYDLKTKKTEPLDETHQPQTLAEYSPNGDKVSYIFENNLYLKDLKTGTITQVTKDGKRNAIINGTTDWVYEEEFAIIKGYTWSPDGKYIGFLKFDESNVKEFSMTYYKDLYPELYTFKYPKAGEDNSKVSVNIYSLASDKTENIDLGEYEYIPRLKWSPAENKLIVQTLNRHQNELKYHLVQISNDKVSATNFYTEKSETYIDIDDNLLILNDGKTILRTSEKNGYNHIYKLCVDGEFTQITTGNWDVIEFLGIDDKNTTIYYTSAENGAINKCIYKIDLTGKKKALLSANSGSSNAEFSNGMNYFIKTYSDANTPPIYTLCNNSGKELTVLENNAGLKATIEKYKFAKKEFITFKGHSEELNGWMIKPANFDPSKKYPVYINIYGGPGSNMVENSWGGINLAYHQLLAQNGYIVVSVDPRGTMYRGEKFKKSTYLQLGKLETEDFISVGKELQSYAIVDPTRIGIMGWSYGGFMTSLAMTKGADVFKMGIAVAPVTNWRYYDNIYTERFMRTPQENENGYDNNSPINHVDKLKGKYLLIHGSGDDNVHYQNTMEMVNALVAADKQFDLFIYPNKNHGIYGGNTRNHLFKMMLDYTLKNL